VTYARLATVLAAVAVCVGCDVDPAATQEPLQSALCVDEAYVVQQITGPSCAAAGCHDADEPKADLDLVSSGLAERLADRSSIHPLCRDRAIVVPGVPQASFLMDKVLGSHGPCGDPMPELSLEERRCLVTWIGSLP
jgi:hypothetical protein